MTPQLLIGIDVGSTTVKAVAVDAATDTIVWSDYQRHETKQPEKTLEFLGRLEAELGIAADNCRAFITGSGGSNLATLIGAKFVQEVTAVSLAVEKLHPEVHSVIELGGQDAKIIVFKPDPETGLRGAGPVLSAGEEGKAVLEPQSWRNKMDMKYSFPTKVL